MYFYCFLLCLLCRQYDDLSLVNGVGVGKPVGVALENGLVLHRIAIDRLGNRTQRIAGLNSIEAFAAGGESLYTVKAGDTLGAVAQAIYGDAMKYKAIFERNADRLANADTIYEGQVIVLPAK